MLRAERRTRVELEDGARDLDVVTGLEAGRLEPPDHTERAQPLLDVGERLRVADVVALEKSLDAPTAHPEAATSHALHRDLLVLRGAIQAMLRESLRHLFGRDGFGGHAL